MARKGYMDSVWEFGSDKEREEMMEPITPENCGEKLLLVRKVSGLSRRELAKVIGCSESTISRIEKKITLPTDDFLFRLIGLVTIGFSKYSNISDKEKEKISEVIGASGGILAGVGGAIGTVSASGAVAGLSAAGITSGLAAIGGGAILGGVAVVASIPVAVGLAGFGLVKGIKKICEANRLSCKEIDGKYEIRPILDSDEEPEGDDPSQAA